MRARRFVGLSTLAAFAGCGPAPTDHPAVAPAIVTLPPAPTEVSPAPAPTEVSPEAARLLEIVHDTGRPIEERRAAVESLGRLGGVGAVAALLSLLPGEYDVFTLDAVYALGEVGDPRALPTLRAMWHETKVEYSGKMGTALHTAITRLEGKEARRDR
jgi:hypothetical protein